jgi:oxygen-dependent protoporphyrinogen oxidase
MNGREALDEAADVLIAGGGIAGLSAAVRLKTLGLRPLVLESSERVGGRMTTDRVNGYAIDTGVTLLGNRFRGLRALSRELDVAAVPVDFSLSLRDAGAERRYRAQTPSDLLFGKGLSLAARWAAVRVLSAIVAAGRGMLHGNSDRLRGLDRESVAEYFARLGRGGQELFAKVFEPGLRAALGGASASSRFVLMQVIWNTLAAGFWNVDGGVDRLPEAAARVVPVALGTRVQGLRLAHGGVEADVETDDGIRTLKARAAILALPGHLIPPIFEGAPEWLSAPASRTAFSRLSSAHVALSRPPDTEHVGYGFAAGSEDGIGVLELEHLRAPGRCPKGKGMVSVYFVDTPSFRCLDASDAELRDKALRVVTRAFPEVAGSNEFVHLIRWPEAIAQFPKGRLTELVALRKRLASWNVPVALAGDWLDGVGSESAVQMGLRAADQVARRASRA